MPIIVVIFILVFVISDPVSCALEIKGIETVLDEAKTKKLLGKEKYEEYSNNRVSFKEKVELLSKKQTELVKSVTLLEKEDSVRVNIIHNLDEQIALQRDIAEIGTNGEDALLTHFALEKELERSSEIRNLSISFILGILASIIASFIFKRFEGRSENSVEKN